MNDEPKTLTPPWQYYRRKGLSEMRPYVPGEDLSGISVSEADRATMAEDARWGMVTGGYIARNPKNHADQRYVAQAYFNANLEPVGVPVVARDEASELRGKLLPALGMAHVRLLARGGPAFALDVLRDLYRIAEGES